ncbi:uncharacterized [Tachysurus ichikawai]
MWPSAGRASNVNDVKLYGDFRFRRTRGTPLTWAVEHQGFSSGLVGLYFNNLPKQVSGERSHKNLMGEMKGSLPLIRFCLISRARVHVCGSLGRSDERFEKREAPIELIRLNP